MENQDIEKIKEMNKETGRLFEVWPVIFFFIGIIIASMVYSHTF